MASIEQVFSHDRAAQGNARSLLTRLSTHFRTDPSTGQNISDRERTASVASGAILAMLGLARRDLPGLLVAAVGGGLIYRGTTGHCELYESLGVSTADSSKEQFAKKRQQANHGTYVSQSFLIDRPAEELYSYWRNFENLPNIMSHLKSVRVVDERRSHWVAKAPRFAGGQVEWDAEITNDEPNTRIDWHSVGGADVPNRGSVRFSRAPGDRGTIVRVVVDYQPPAGNLGRMAAKLFGEAPERQIREDMRSFKRVMEVGEALTTQGQPRGTCTGRGKRSGQ